MTRMRVVVGLRQLTPGRIGGMETYVRALLQEWGDTQRETEWIVLVNAPAAPTFTSPGPWMRFEAVPDAHDLNRWRSVIESYAPAIYFSPLLTIDPPDVAMPTVINIPDLQHCVYPGFFAPEVLEFRRLHYPLSARRASAIITLSEHAKTSIVSRLGVNPEKIHAIPLAADARFDTPAGKGQCAAFREKHRLPENFGYYPAHYWPHKNHAALFDALALYRNRHGEPPVIALSGFSAEDAAGLRRAARRAGVEGSTRLLGYLPREELPVAYQAARFLVFPSLFEGFGLPVAEAFASGCPVACADATSLPELSAGAALLFDPGDVSALADAIRALDRDDALRARLIAAGRARAGQLTWRHTARATHEILQRLHVSQRAKRAGASWIPVVGVPLREDGGVDRCRLPVLSEPAVLHFFRPGSITDAASRARAGLLQGSGLAATVGGLAPLAGGAPRLYHYDYRRLKSEDYLPLETLWVGPDSSRSLHGWLRDAPPAGRSGYEVWLRLATSGAIGNNPELQTFTRGDAPALAPSLGAALSARYYGIPDPHWLLQLGETTVQRLPVIGRELSRRHRTRKWLGKILGGYYYWRQTSRLPPGWQAGFRLHFHTKTVAGPAEDGWIGRITRMTFQRPADGRVKLVLDSPLWPLSKPPRVKIMWNGIALFDAFLTRRGRYPLSWPWPSGAGESLVLEVTSGSAFIPAELGLGSDERSLSIRVIQD